MRLLHVTRSLSIASGGTAEAVRSLCCGLAAKGVHNEVAVLDPQSEEGTSMTLPCGVHWLGTRVGGYGYSPKMLPWLQEHLGDYDAVVVHGLWQYGGLAVRRAVHARGAGAPPYFVFPHGMLDPWFKHQHPLKHLKKWLYWPWGEYRVLRDAKGVLFTSETERDMARQSFGLYRCHEMVAPLGIGAPELERTRQLESLYGAFPELRGKNFLLFLGRIHPKKGLDLLVSAFATLKRQEKAAANLHLVIAGSAAGSGDAEKHESDIREQVIQSGLSDSVTFTGLITGDIKWGALLGCEAFVLPSHQENFGISVVEALACSRPVLISDKVNIWHEIIDDGAGISGSDTEADTLGMLSRWTLMSDSQREAMRQQARRSFERRFEIQSAARHLISLLSGQPDPSRTPALERAPVVA
jgi:glycosyltransferase involved in cell wall biosynthesis